MIYLFMYLCQNFKNYIYQMEEHRLLEMKPGYDVKQFNRIYKNVIPFKKKLCSEISSSRFGLEYQDICAWFDIKILHVYNKHCLEFTENKLQAYIINSMKVFKYRVIRAAYQKKYTDNQLEYLDNYSYAHDLPDSDNSEFKSTLLNIVENFFKNNLSEEAYLVYQIELHIPPYIYQKLLASKKLKQRIPSQLIAEYLSIEGKEAIPYIDSLRNEIKEAIKKAKRDLNSPLALNYFTN
jgi:hypothetical protein